MSGDDCDRRIFDAMKRRPALRTVCAWCPGFDPHDPANKDISHTICPTCAARVLAEDEAHGQATDRRHAELLQALGGRATEACPTCEGSGDGARDGDSDESRPCPQCGGSGTVTQR